MVIGNTLPGLFQISLSHLHSAITSDSSSCLTGVGPDVFFRCYSSSVAADEAQ